MAARRPIPIPWRQRWREFRVSQLPVITFIVLVLAIGTLWMRYVHPANIVGEVESTRLPVVSTVAGRVEALHVGLLQPVTNGQILVEISVADPQSQQSQLAAIEADLRLIQARMALDHARFGLDQAREVGMQRRARLDLMNERILLTLAEIGLRQAEAEFERNQKLFEQQLIPRGLNLPGDGSDNRFNYGLDVALRDRDTLRAEVQHRHRIVAELESALTETITLADGAVELAAADTAVENAIRAQQAALDQTLKPVLLRATMDGFVTSISNRVGDHILPGSPVLVLGGSRNDRVVAWVRPPVTAPPQVGDRVLVRRMSVGRVTTSGTVIEVGRQFEPLSAALQPPGGNAAYLEMGLPLLVLLHDPGDFLPGEAVQIEVTVKRRSSAE